MREFVSRTLGNARHEVVTAENGVQTLEALEQDGFDLLLSDIVMPELAALCLR